MAKRKNHGGRRSASHPARGIAPGSFKKPRGGTGRGRESVTAAEKLRVDQIMAERQELAKIVVSVFRGAREDKGRKQDQMAHALGRTVNAVSNMETLRTDWSIPDGILYIRELDPQDEYFDYIMERLKLEVRRFYANRAKQLRFSTNSR